MVLTKPVPRRCIGQLTAATQTACIVSSLYPTVKLTSRSAFLINVRNTVHGIGFSIGCAGTRHRMSLLGGLLGG